MDVSPVVVLFFVLAAPHFVTLVYYLICKSILHRSRTDDSSTPSGFRGRPMQDLGMFVIIPTYNEETTIWKKLESILHSTYPLARLEVVVVDGHSSDRTVEIAVSFRERHPEFPLQIIRQNSRSGKSQAVKELLEACRSDVAVITAAASLLLPDTLRAIATRFEEHGIGAVTGVQRIREESDIATRLESLYSDFYTVLRLAESRVDSTPIFRGEVTAVRSNLSKRVRYGHLAPLADDSDLAVQVRLLGWRSVAEPTAGFVEIAPPTLVSRFKQKRRRGSGLVRLMARSLPQVMKLKAARAYKLIVLANFVMLVVAPLTLIPTILVVTYESAVVLGSWAIALFATLVGCLSAMLLFHLRPASLIVGYLHSQVSLLAGIPGAFSTQSTWSQIKEVRARWNRTYGH